MYDYEEEVEVGSSGESIVDVVQIGNNVDIHANNGTYETFWIMLVDKEVHTIQTSFTDGCNNEYVEGILCWMGCQWMNNFIPGKPISSYPSKIIWKTL